MTECLAKQRKYLKPAVVSLRQDNLIVAQLIMDSPIFHGYEPATGPCPEPHEASGHFHILFLRGPFDGYYCCLV